MLKYVTASFLLQHTITILYMHAQISQPNVVVRNLTGYSRFKFATFYFIRKGRSLSILLHSTSLGGSKG